MKWFTEREDEVTGYEEAGVDDTPAEPVVEEEVQPLPEHNEAEDVRQTISDLLDARAKAIADEDAEQAAAIGKKVRTLRQEFGV